MHTCILKKKVLKNVPKILTYKRPPSYVMRGTFTGITCMGAGRGWGKSRPSPPLEKKINIGSKKTVQTNFVTCKRPTSYVMRGTFTQIGPNVMH